jgi:hypothetical protein
MKRTLLTLFAVLGASALTASAIPITLAGPPGGGNWHYASPGGTVGYEFTANRSLSVISLGVFDYGGDGLHGSHQVGLWDSGGALLGSVTIPAATGAPLSGGYRWVSITAPLVAGNNYVLGAEYHADSGGDWFRDQAIIDPAFSLVQDLYLDNPAGLARPTIGYFNDGTRAWYGPNLKAVPDGGTTLVLLGGALAGLGVLRRKYHG